MKKQSEQQTTQTEDSCNPSAAETRRKLQKEFLFEFVKTVVFALAAATTLVSGSIAWFAANTGVHSQTSSISPMKDAIRLASTGHRQTAEKDLLNLAEGETLPYEDEIYYYTEDGTIALRLSEDNIVVSPGASGTVTFYIIPTRDGAVALTLYVSLVGYNKTENSTSAERITDPILDALLSGHILLFQDKDENGHYSGWLGTENTIPIFLPDAQKDKPEKVTVHWIWPLRYENMRSDLYVDENQAENEGFLLFLDEQATSMTQISDGSYSYSRIYLTNEKNLATIASRSKAYNLADEYIGTNAQYLYLAIQTSAVPAETNCQKRSGH